MTGCPPQEGCQCGDNERTVTTMVIPSEAGSISLSPEKTLYNRGEIIDATFSPAENYKHYFWADSSGFNNFNPEMVIPVWVTDNIELTACAMWKKRKVHVYWDTNVDVNIPGDAIEQGSTYFIVEREVDSIATFLGSIKSNLPPLPPGQIRKMTWEVVNIPTPLGQRWDETSCSIKVEGPSSPTATPIYVHVGAGVWEENVPIYRIDISPVPVEGAIWDGTIYCNRCGCEQCTCLPVFPYDSAESVEVRSFTFAMIPGPYTAFVFWLGMPGYNLQASTGYTFPGTTGGDMDIFGFYVDRIHLIPAIISGQGVIKIESGGYGERWGYDPLPFCTEGNCSGWLQEQPVENCINIVGNEVKLKAEACSNAWVFDRWEYYSGEGESGSWIDLPGIGDELTIYMNCWGYPDENSGRLHVPWGKTDFQVLATFRQRKALEVESMHVPPGSESEADFYLQENCYDVDSITLQCDDEVIEILNDYDIFCFNGHGITGGYLCIAGSNVCESSIEPSEVSQSLQPAKTYLFVYLRACYAGWIATEWKEAFKSNCVLGFYSSITWECGDIFDNNFWIQVFSDEEATVNSAAENAKIFTEQYFKNKGQNITVPLVVLGDAYLQ